jgi:hypothetical protein
MLYIKNIKKLASITAGTGGTIALPDIDWWNGVRYYSFVVVVSDITGTPTNVKFNLNEIVSGSVKVASPVLTFTTTGTDKSLDNASVGNAIELVYSFAGGASPTVTADVYVVGYTK